MQQIAHVTTVLVCRRRETNGICNALLWSRVLPDSQKQDIVTACLMQLPSLAPDDLNSKLLLPHSNLTFLFVERAVALGSL